MKCGSDSDYVTKSMILIPLNAVYMYAHDGSDLQVSVLLGVVDWCGTKPSGPRSGSVGHVAGIIPGYRPGGRQV